MGRLLKRNNAFSGLFITFEGCEGSGKTTHIKALAGFLQRKGYRVCATREPGGVKIAEQIRAILLDVKNKKMNSVCELLLYQASRAQINAEVIMPALKKGQIVICDRYQDATFAYQGYGEGIDTRFIQTIAAYPGAYIEPDLTILMDIDVHKGLSRSVSKDRIDQKTCAFHQRVRRGYLALAQQYPKRIKLINVNDEYKVNQQRIREVVLDVIARHTGK